MMNGQRNLNNSIHTGSARSVNPSASAFCWPRVGKSSYRILLIVNSPPLNYLTNVKINIRAAFGVISYYRLENQPYKRPIFSNLTVPAARGRNVLTSYSPANLIYDVVSHTDTGEIPEQQSEVATNLILSKDVLPRNGTSMDTSPYPYFFTWIKNARRTGWKKLPIPHVCSMTTSLPIPRKEEKVNMINKTMRNWTTWTAAILLFLFLLHPSRQPRPRQTSGRNSSATRSPETYLT